MKKYIDIEKLPPLFISGTDENGDALVTLSEVRKALSLALVDVDEPVQSGQSCGAKMDGKEDTEK